MIRPHVVSFGDILTKLEPKREEREKEGGREGARCGEGERERKRGLESPHLILTIHSNLPLCQMK